MVKQADNTGEAIDRLARELAAPFPAESVGWKPQVVSGSRCLAAAYIDARDVMDRLDAVVGPAGWQDGYQFLPGGMVVCTLRLCLAGSWVEKSDVGGESEQSDAGDRHKAAVSDALKRAAVKFGVGRYLYRLEQQWVDYDPKTRTIPITPRLPPWARPGTKERPLVAVPDLPPPAPAEPEENAHTVGEEVARQKVGRVVERSAAPRPMGVSPLAKVSKAQVHLIEELIKKTGVDPVRFCQRHKVKTIIDLTQEEYAIALVNLEGRQRRLAEEAEDDPIGAAEREAIQSEPRRARA